MIEGIIEFIFEIVGELLFQVFAEVMAEFGFESLKNAAKPVKSANPFYAGCGLLILGCLLGLGVSLLVPHPFWQRHPLPGMSLVLAPAGTGVVMHFLGSWRRKKGGNPTCLATFWGGACFAFGMAWVRWLMVGNG